MKRGLAPIVDDNSSIVVLGTLPATRLFGCSSTTPTRPINSGPFSPARSARRSGGRTPSDLSSSRLGESHFGDVLDNADRVGSTDSAITTANPNGFADLFGRFPRLRRVAFNGTKAAALWGTHIRSRPGVPHDSLTTKTLPSSSGTLGRHVLPLAAKVVQWRRFLRQSD